MKDKEYIKTLTEMMESQKQRLFKYACYRVGNEADAEDLLQNVYLSMLERRPSSATPVNLQAYIFRSLVNACYDHQKRTKTLPLPDIDTLDLSEKPTNFEEEAVFIRSLMATMPEGLQDFVRLRIYAEMTFDEVAETMGVSATTAKRRFYEGLEYLRHKYDMI